MRIRMGKITTTFSICAMAIAVITAIAVSAKIYRYELVLSPKVEEMIKTTRQLLAHERKRGNNR